MWDGETWELLHTLGRTEFALSLDLQDQGVSALAGWLALRRAGLLVADTTVSFPSASIESPLRLTIERLNGRVRAWVNPTGESEQAVLEFDEILRSESTGEGSLGVIWPSGVGLASLTALERKHAKFLRQWGFAEKYFSQKSYDAAAEQYHDLAAQFLDHPSSAATALWQEAKYKQAVSRLALGQSDPAEAIFQQLSSEPGHRWPVYATAQLWS